MLYLMICEIYLTPIVEYFFFFVFIIILFYFFLLVINKNVTALYNSNINVFNEIYTINVHVFAFIYLLPSFSTVDGRLGNFLVVFFFPFPFISSLFLFFFLVQQIQEVTFNFLTSGYTILNFCQKQWYRCICKKNS